ncbi:MAG: crossover junction endodeoxyribonuclease RuvC [bacterium]|nr:crossover junction endodeoxyribonuclease RuvC [bacterium]
MIISSGNFLSSVTVLGIDPGSHRCGWSIVQGSPGNYTALDYGCITPPAECQPGERLLYIYEQINDIIERYHPSELSIEKLFFNKNITSCIGVAEARGVVLLSAQQAELAIREYTPADIKKALTGSGKATKKEITLMVMAYLGLKKKPTPDDTADALAIAITHICSRTLNPLLTAAQ